MTKRMIWLGTDGGGINRLSPQTGRFKHYLSTYPSKVVSVIDYDVATLLYSGFGEGLFCFDPITEMLMPVENNRFPGITSLGFDKAGRLWIGTHNASVSGPVLHLNAC